MQTDFKLYKVDMKYSRNLHNIGDTAISIPESLKWNGLINGMNMFSDDFMEDGREEQPEQERKEFLCLEDWV